MASSSENSTSEPLSATSNSATTSFYRNIVPQITAWTQSPSFTAAESDRVPFDLATFFAVVSELKVENVPLTWHGGLGEVGRGATAQIQEAIITADHRFAFKRFSFPGSEGASERRTVQAAMIELLALSHPALRNHPNILRMYGVCQDMLTTNDVFQPALVVEKSVFGDLGVFMSQRGSYLDGNTRVELCADVIAAVAALHENGTPNETLLILPSTAADSQTKALSMGTSSPKTF